MAGKPPKKLDASEILQKLGEIRQAMPRPKNPRPRARQSDAATRSASLAGSMEDFEMEAITEALESMVDELSDAVAEAREKTLQDALKIYYAAEELARDPEHAHLIPHVETMRKAFEHDFGYPIPPKKK